MYNLHEVGTTVLLKTAKCPKTFEVGCTIVRENFSGEMLVFCSLERKQRSCNFYRSDASMYLHVAIIMHMSPSEQEWCMP